MGAQIFVFISKVYKSVEILTLRWESLRQCSSDSLESILTLFFLGRDDFTFTCCGILFFCSCEYILLLYDIIKEILSHHPTSVKCAFHFCFVSFCVCFILLKRFYFVKTLWCCCCRLFCLFVCIFQTSAVCIHTTALIGDITVKR